MPVRSVNSARASVIAGIIGGDGHAHVAQREADRLADAAGSAGDDCNACHFSLLFCFCAPRQAHPAFKFAPDQRAASSCPSSLSLRQASREVGAARLHEGLAAADRELLQRLEAIGGEAGRERSRPCVTPCAG
jgi:hypothetical protein